MAQSNEKTKEFVRRLTAGTVAGGVDWKRTASDHEFIVMTPAGEVRIGSEEADDDHPFRLIVKNPDGAVVADERTVPGDWYSVWEQEIADLYRAARNSALAVDSTLDNLTASLGLPDAPSPPPAPAGDDDIPF